MYSTTGKLTPGLSCFELDIYLLSNQRWLGSLEWDKGHKKFIWPLPIYFILKEGNVGSNTNQLINILYTLWFSSMLQIFFLVYLNLLYILICLTVESFKFWCGRVYQCFFFSPWKFIISTLLASYTITFFEKSICSPLI